MAVQPLISVVIPVYNGAPFLADSLGSIVAQSHSRLDIVVVDDGSTDGSDRLIRAWAARDSRVRPIFAGHGGPEHARNVGVAAARGDFVAHLDQDDIAAPSRLSAQIDWMHVHGLDVCGSCTWVFGERRYLRWVPERGEDIRREYVFRAAMIHSTVLMAAAIARAHTFREDIVCGGQELLTRLVLRYRVGNVPQMLVKYRRHPNQRSRVVLERWRVESRAAMERYFFGLFPDATPADYRAVLHVAEARPFTDAAQEDLAAKWLDRLSGTADPVLRRVMAERWAAVCPTSTKP